jgi:hypothetical protein
MALKLKKCLKLGKPMREQAKRIAAQRQRRIEDERQRLGLAGRRR